MLAACLTIVFLHSATVEVFAQSDQTQKIDTARDEKSTYVTGITAGRARSLVGVVLGLVSVIVGWRAKARSADRGSSARKLTITTLVLGSGAIILSVIHLTTISGGFGTGGGKAGAIVSVVLGLIGMLLGRAAWLRAK